MILSYIKRKDLKYINRDMRKIIVLESDPERLKYQTENGIFIPIFTGDPDDKELYKQAVDGFLNFPWDHYSSRF